MAVDRNLVLNEPDAFRLSEREIVQIVRSTPETSFVLLAGTPGTYSSSGGRVFNSDVDATPFPPILRGSKEFGLLMPAMSRAKLSEILRRASEENGTSRYRILENAGIIVLSPVLPLDGGLKLAGGSLSSVILKLTDNNGFLVEKRIGSKSRFSLDGVTRHRAEAKFLHRMNHETTNLFPKLLYRYDSPDEFVFATSFFPAYTAAEMMFQGRMNGRDLCDLLIQVYERLRREVYPLPSMPRTGAVQSYPEIISRRTAELVGEVSDASSDMIRGVLSARHVRINGRLCRPLSQILSELSLSVPGKALLDLRSARTLCHGDLILEDILVSPRPDPEFQLIDPNPGNSHPVFDVAKTLLSLLIGYEFFYFNKFTLAIEGNAKEINVKVAVAPEYRDLLQEYRSAVRFFVAYLSAELVGTLELDRAHWQSQLRMATALHSLALPWFHQMHHRSPRRAVALLTAGMFHADLALSEPDLDLGAEDWLNN